MSLVDRGQHAAQQAAPTLPVTPGAPPPARQPPVQAPGGKPYRLLYLVAAVLAVVGVVTAAVLLFNRPSTAGTNPPPEVSTPAALPSTSPSPTLNARQQAAADAQAAYGAYIRARDEMSQAGSSAAAEAKVLPFTTASERDYIKRAARERREQKIQSEGYTKVTTQVQSLDLKADPPTAQLTVCLDQTGVTATKAGKPLSPPRFIKEIVDMQMRDGRWVVAIASTPDTPEQRNRTSCTA